MILVSSSDDRVSLLPPPPIYRALSDQNTMTSALHPVGGASLVHARADASRAVRSRRLPVSRLPRSVPSAASSSAASSAATDTVEAFNASNPEVRPYAGYVAPEVRPEVIVKMPSPGDLDAIDDRLWVPQTADVSFRPLLLNVSQGYYVNLLRVRGGGGVLSRHRHPGPVHGWVLKGRWAYLEHDWVAEEGSYVFEPPGEASYNSRRPPRKTRHGPRHPRGPPTRRLKKKAIPNAHHR